MHDVTIGEDILEEARNSPFKAFLKRLFRNKGATIGLIILIIILSAVILAPVLTKYDFAAIDVRAKFQLPSAEHWFGTDQLGRDIFTRILYGGRYSLQIGLFASIAAACGGILLGALAGYYGGTLDNIIMRFMDILQSIPGILLSIVVSAALGNGVYETILALSIGYSTGYCRILRASILSVRKLEYIDASKMDNDSTPKTIFKHVLPNAFSPVIVHMTMSTANIILSAAGLSFIGLGIQPPNPEWGAMLSESRSFMQDCPYMVIFPGLCIMVTVLSLNLLGDGLRDALDPKLKR